ncbi:hypothetical protein D3C75_1212460 [compost metagenome]
MRELYSADAVYMQNQFKANGALLVDGGRITDAGDRDELLNRYPDATHIRWKG